VNTFFEEGKLAFIYLSISGGAARQQQQEEERSLKRM
jgi:hypothetical protein